MDIAKLRFAGAVGLAVRKGKKDSLIETLRDPDYQLSMEDRELLAQMISGELRRGRGRSKEGLTTRLVRAASSDLKTVTRMAARHRDKLRDEHGRRHLLPGTRVKINDRAVELAMAEFEQSGRKLKHNSKEIRDLLSRPEDRWS